MTTETQSPQPAPTVPCARCDTPGACREHEPDLHAAARRVIADRERYGWSPEADRAIDAMGDALAAQPASSGVSAAAPGFSSGVSPSPAERDDARERVERLKFELRQAMIDYGSAERANDPDRIRETSTRGVALIDSLAPISKVQPKGAANAVLHTAEHLLALLHPDTLSAAKDTAGALITMLRIQAPA